jgi:beta-alanine--pyruvate transaminase
MYYTDIDGNKVLDGTAGLWCCNAGHARPRIVEAIARQARELDYAPAFQMGHPKIFELAARLVTYMPPGIDHVFFTNSGSESVETALKIAIAYQRARGEGTRFRLIGRERGYHGVNFGGISVGGMVNNRKFFGGLLTGVEHLPHTYNRAEQAITKGEPEWGAHLADELENIVALHSAQNIAAVIVEPMAGSTGVLPAPKGYLKRLRQICDKHGILLIFDEVITGFGRLGAPFAATRFKVTPDIITLAKGITNAAVPMGAVCVRGGIYDSIVNAAAAGIELFHGYTYSGHPLAAAAGLATLALYKSDGLFERAASLESYWEDAFHSLRGSPHVIDVRTIGIVAGIELEPRPGAPVARAFETFLKCFDAGVMIRQTGDTLALSPPLIVEKAQIDQIVSTIASTLRTVA